MYDAPNGEKDAEEHQEAAYSVHYIIEFHDACSVISLPDLDGKGDHQDYSQDIEEGNDHGMACLCKPQEERMQHQDQRDAEGADDDEVQFLIGETGLPLVVQGKKITVKAGDDKYDII